MNLSVPQAILQLNQVSKHYGTKTVVNQVSMRIEQGRITVVVGTSGSGKSTLLRMINRLIPMSSGDMLLDGADIQRIDPTTLRRGMGYVIQGNGLFPHRTVAQNIATVPQLLHWSRARIEARVAHLLELFGLPSAQFAQRYPHELSGGQQQRVGVARALAAEPRILLMDEPFGALDPVIRAKAQSDLLAVQRQLGTTVILVTHDMDEALRLGDTIAIMDGGQLLQHDTPQAILTRPANAFCAQMVGQADRALKLLALTHVRAHMRPSTESLCAHSIEATRSLREALSEMLWHGVDGLRVTEAHHVIGTLALSEVLQAARGAHV